MNLDQLKRTISNKIRDLQALQNESQQACEPVALDQTRVGRLSRMDAMQSQAMNQAAQRRRSTEIKRLETALQGIDKDSFGYCENCDELISEGRLMLDPAMRYCIACAQAREQQT